MDELTHAIGAMEENDAIGCMVLTGSAKAFAAGADIKEMAGKKYIDVFREDFITANWEAAYVPESRLLRRWPAMRWAVAANWR